VLGLVKKFAIADRMAVFADPVFADPQSYSSAANWLAVLAFSLRIYADFSAYSDMARGLAHFFGYRLAVNFNAPYLAPNIAEFWRRWHISLSTWLRDYIFIPLGGSRGSPWLTARNLIIVMTLGGLWHGANWTYLFWGLYHGLLLVLHRIWKSNVNVKVNNHIINNIYILLSTLFTFILVSIGWVLFQPDGGKCLAMISQLLAFHGGLPLDPHPRSLWWTALAMLLATAFFATWRKWLQTMPPALAGGTLALAVCLAQVLAPNGEKVFIYFTF
jgi:D-alanyl-lipoteichoic acid acyltransferase DltB (MBOAT superfamily)